MGAKTALVSIHPEKIQISKPRVEAENVFEARIEEEIFQEATDQLWLVTDQSTRLHALVANESAMNEAFREGDRVSCGLHLDDLVIMQTE